MSFWPKVAAATAFGMLLAGSVEAAPGHLAEMTLGYTYFNRPGAEVSTHDAAVADCATIANKTRAMDEAGQMDMGLLGNAIQGGMAAAYHRSAAGAGLENCMVVREWRVVKLPEAEGKALSGLPHEQLRAALAPWIGAQTPNGEVVRSWTNEAANGATKRSKMRPDNLREGQLSLIAATGQTLEQFKAEAVTPQKPVKLDPKWPKKAIKPADMANIPTGAAVIMIQVRGGDIAGGYNVNLARMGSDPAVEPSRTDFAPDVIYAGGRGGNLWAVVVPPGRWRVQNLMSLNLCLGAPAFEVKAGEVVYAGAFDLNAAELGPNMSLEPAKAWLAGQPSAETLRAADYVNGSRSQCGGPAIYAVEINGAPFEPDYAWGGAPSRP